MKMRKRNVLSLRNTSLFVLLLLSVTTLSNATERVGTKSSYLKNLENENNISYDKIKNSPAIYITSMCYTNTKDNNGTFISNPCYSCHTKGKIPSNFFDDSLLQKEYLFTAEKARKNPFSNLFKDRSRSVSKITDTDILHYVRESNYFDANGSISLAQALPEDWKGYRPDCYFNFDAEGFDRDKEGKYTLWRAFRYYPFLGTFWPTNGSTDDVLIRLDPVFAQDAEGHFSKEVYKLNLSIVEAVIKRKEIKLPSEVDEILYGVDLNQNGKLDRSDRISVTNRHTLSYVGKAKKLLDQGEIHLKLGRFPSNTEFLHSVRYLDWDEKAGHITMSARMKELRYAKKYAFRTYHQVQEVASDEMQKRGIESFTGDSRRALVWGNYEVGLDNNIGWKYQGFIEDKKGDLRPQTEEETISCMGCHAHLGATTDSIFAFARKFEGVDKNSADYGWNHWSQKGLSGVKEPQVTYAQRGKKYEYSFYLHHNHTGNEFRDNDEVRSKFFKPDGSAKKEMMEKLHYDISVLLFPSYERAMMLNKGYKILVGEQSYIYGREGNVKSVTHVKKVFKEGEKTGIKEVINR